LSRGTRWSVLAVFRRTFYCIDDEDALFCMGSPAVGRAPLTVLCAVSQPINWRASNLRAGARADFDGRSLIVDGRFVFPFVGARIWNPPRELARIDRRAVASGLSALAAEARCRAPRDGFGPLIERLCRAPAADPSPIPSTPLARAASRGIAALGTWLREGPFGAGAGVPALPSAPEDLIGLGPGLSPSGDDFLGGVMIALRALGAGAAAQALAGRLLPLARRKTPFISYAHLRCAAEGVGAEPLHRAVAAVAAPSARDIGVSLDDLDRFGATSGWDALAGTALVLGNFAGSGWKCPRGRVGAQPAISRRDEP
jgi:hypothetical protein